MYPYVRFVCRVIVRSFGIRIGVVGLDRFDAAGQTYVLMANHESVFDIFATPIAVPMHLTAVEAAYHFKIPFWGFLIRRLDCVPIHRHDPARAREDLQIARDVVTGGTSIIILPEGHRTIDGAIGPFKKGPFHLAKNAGVAILPLAFCGLFDIKPKHGWKITPGRAFVVFGEPIAAATVQSSSVDELMHLVRKRIIALREEGDRLRGTSSVASLQQ